MSTNKDKIIQFIKDETSKCIQNNSYTFEKCNALIISMELFLDRSNVSRTLNELHRTGILIKKNGRPTSYISKDVLHNKFPFASFPDVLLKNAKIEDYISQPSNPIQQSATKSFSIIGSQKGGSLYDLMNQALPVLYLSKNFFKIIILKGSFGTGKKYFLRQMLDRAKQMNLIPQKSDICFLEFPEIIPDFYHLTQKLDTLDHCYILNIVLSSTHFQQENLSSFVNLLATYYENKVEIPLIALTVSEKFDPSILQTLSPVILNFPSLDERSETEVLQLTLSMIQQESIRLAKNISISVEFLRTLSANIHNCHQMEQEILFAVSKSLFSSYTKGEVNTLYLEPGFLSESCNVDQKISSSYVLQHFPDTITLNYQQPYDFANDFSTLSFNSSAENESNYELSDYFTRNFTLCNEADLKDVTGSYSEDWLLSSIRQLFTKSVYYVDPALTDNLCLHISSVFNGSFNIKKMTLPEVTYTIPLVQKLLALANENHLTISKTQEKYLSILLHYCENLLNDFHIPIIIASRHQMIMNNYSNIFNLHYNRRLIYSFAIPETSNEKESSYLSRLYQFALKINRGQGVLILSDDDLKSQISSYFFPKTKLVSYCIPLHSFLILRAIIDLISNEKATVFSIIPNLLIKQQDTFSVLKDTTLKSYTLRSADENLLFVRKLMPGLDSVHINEYFYSALKQILNELEIEMTNSRILNFLFHGNCLLFQRKYRMNFYDNIADIHLNIDPDLFDLLKNCIEHIPELTKYEFTEKEFYVLYQALVYGGF